MRLVASCVGLLLVCGCGDDSAAPDAAVDAPRPVDASVDAPATGPQNGVVVLRHLGLMDGGAADPNNFFDFVGDGGSQNALASLAILNGMIQQGIDTGGLRLLGQLKSYDDPVNDPDVQVALFHAFDGDSDPNNDFGGSGVFVIDPASVTNNDPNMPKSVLMTGHITNGTLYASASGDVALQLGAVTFHLVNGRMRATVMQSGSATSIQNGVLGGVLPACTAKRVPITQLSTTLLDLLTSRGCNVLPDGGATQCGTSIQPDINLNGGGLDTFDNDFGTITACHHNGTTITGPDCACDTSLNGGDGYSVVQFFDAVSARIAGVAPPDAGSP
jgi:hypothetical protein